jgi:hypothetical protein
MQLREIQARMPRGGDWRSDEPHRELSLSLREITIHVAQVIVVALAQD